MFDNLSARLASVVEGLRGRGRLTEENIGDTLRQVRMALLEADVALPVVKTFIDGVKARVVGQEIHLYEGGLKTATSKPELFASGLLLPRLAGEVHRAVVVEGLPYLVRWEPLGEGHVVLRHAVPCSPCGHRSCPVPGHPCMAGHAVADVVRAAGLLLARAPGGVSA